MRKDGGDLTGALESFQAGLDIRRTLANADPENAGWQADLAASHGKLGQTFRDMGDTRQARAMFEAGRRIIAPLADASEMQLWQDYLANFDNDIALLDD